MLPFFSATAGPFVLKFGMVFRNGVGQTAKQFRVEWMRHCRVIAYQMYVKEGRICFETESDVTMCWFHLIKVSFI